LAVGALATLIGNAAAQTFPTKTLRLIVPFPAGGGGDVMARTIAPLLSDGLGQPMIIENRAGAGTLIASEFVAKIPADGHTILVAYPSFVISPSLYGIARVDPIKEFRAVGQVIAITMGIAVHPSLPVKSIKELIALAHSKPGEITYGAGAGTGHYVIGEMLRLSRKIQITPIPYQGSAQMYPALLGGHISMIVTNVSEMAPFATIGKLRPIVVTTHTRDDMLPHVQTMREAGFPDLEAAAWGGLVVRAGTPQGAISRLYTELERTLRYPALVEKLKGLGMHVTPGTPEQFGALIASEFARYGKVIHEAGIKIN
jgi:tripartite-type tricarboxylate transporter receptor subunit TctC